MRKVMSEDYVLVQHDCGVIVILDHRGRIRYHSAEHPVMTEEELNSFLRSFMDTTE